MAEPPHIDDPTPINVEIFAGTCMSLLITKAMIREMLMVEIIIGRDCAPVFSITFKF